MTQFREMSPDEAAILVHDVLLFRGPLAQDVAVRTVLAAVGAVDADAPAVEASINTALTRRWLDQPRRGVVRAVLPEAVQYTPEQWRRCILEAASVERLAREELIHATERWARENLGLRSGPSAGGSAIHKALRTALEDAIAAGELDSAPDGQLVPALSRRPRAHSSPGRSSPSEIEVRLAVALAAVDGLPHFEEQQLILEHAVRRGLDREHAERLIARNLESVIDVVASVNEYQPGPPPAGRVLLDFLTKVAAVDGALVGAEVAFLETVAGALGIPVVGKPASR